MRLSLIHLKLVVLFETLCPVKPLHIVYYCIEQEYCRYLCVAITKS